MVLQYIAQRFHYYLLQQLYYSFYNTKVGVASDIIFNNQGGFYFKTQKDLTSILLELSKKPMLIEKNGERNFQMRDKFRWSIITKEYLKVINQMMCNEK